MRPARHRGEIDAIVDGAWPDHCVIYSGKQQPNGYGRVSIDGSYRRAHVYACERAHGPKPSDKSDAAHSCGVAMCINPRHLRWATRAENMADCIEHGTTNRGRSSKLSGAAVRHIRARYMAGGWTQQELADTYGVHIMTINDIINRKTWRHI